MSGNLDWAALVYLLMALLLVSGAAYGFRRIRGSPRAAVFGVVFWTALIVAIVFAYNAFN
jgi:hypothetical protein